MASSRDKLQFLSKAASVDEDELPSDLETTSDAYERYQFHLSDAYELCKVFEDIFKATGPEERMIRRLDSEIFQHNKWSVTFALKYKLMRNLIAQRARLSIIRDCVIRLKSFTTFVQDVVNVARQEMESWDAICRNSLDSPPQSKLDCLNSICDDLRVHTNHFSSIVHCLHNASNQLGRSILQLAVQLTAIEKRVKRLRDKTILWIERFIRVGIKVLAHSDLERTTSDVLWNIARGIEEYNAIVLSIKDCSCNPQSIAFTDLLSCMACEKAKYVAIHTYRHIACSDEIHHVLKKSKERERMLDLLDRISPVMEVYQNDWQILSNFLSVFAQSTSLLRSSLRSSTKGKRRKRKNSSRKSKNDKKTVKWEDTDDYGIREKLMQHYADALWMHFGGLISDFLDDMCWGSVDDCDRMMGRVNFISHFAIMVLEKVLQHLCFRDLFPVQGRKSLLICSIKLHIRAALSACDMNICEAIGASTVDKCSPTPLNDTLSCTKTACQLRDSFQPLIGIFNMLQKLTNDATLPCTWKETLPLQVTCLTRCEIVCEMAARWSHSQTSQLLSSWNLPQFLLVCYSDLKILSDELTTLVSVSRPKFVDERILLTYDENSVYVLAELIHQRISNVAISMQTLSSCITKKFSEIFRKKALDFFESSLPVGKVWKKKGEPPSDPLPYAERAIDELVEPVIDACNSLSPNAQTSAFCITLNALCYAWTSVILQKKIRFSVIGAMQLQQDFNYVKKYLNDMIQNEIVKQSVLEMDVFNELKGIIELLLEQPRYGRSASRGRVPSSMCCDESAVSTVESAYQASNGFGTSRPSSVPNANLWLSLRVHGGSRSWKIPSCFTTTGE